MRHYQKMCLMVFATVVALSTLVASSGEAKERNRDFQGSYETGKGRSGTVSGSVSGNLRDGVTREQTITTPDGKTPNRSSVTKFDKESGQFNRTVTAPNGQTRTFTGQGDGQGNRSGSYTTSTGQSGTFNTSRERNEDGSVTRQQNWTDQDGESKSRSATHRFDPATNTINRTVTAPNGETRSGSIVITPDE